MPHHWVPPTVVLLCVLMVCCGSELPPCSIHNAIVPAQAVADHNLAPPGNQAQFSLSSSVSGNCPLPADKMGVWSTSDPADTVIDNTTEPQATVTCTGAASSPVLVQNSGLIRGGTPFPPATLVCK